jgi:hypothetical protein
MAKLNPPYKRCEECGLKVKSTKHNEGEQHKRRAATKRK